MQKEVHMSPIKGISEIVRLPRLGKIRLGVKKSTDSGVSYPTPTDYFVCPGEVKKVFGEKPKELRIMFPTEDSEQWASQYLRCYSSTRGLICRGDGKTAVARVDVKTGEIAARDAVATELREIVCSPDSCAYQQRGQCRRVMNLQFLIPDCPGFGVYQLDTTSYHSMLNVNSGLALIKSICQRVSMIPLSLKLVAKEVQPDGRKKKVYVLSLTCPYSLSEIQRYAQIPPAKALILPPPDSEAPDDLFSDEILKEGETRQSSPCDEELARLWDKAKTRVWHLNVQDSQISGWFERNYRISVKLKDFESVLPPANLTAEQLAHFLRAVERYSSST
jgi:hypothetical protein